MGKYACVCMSVCLSVCLSVCMSVRHEAHVLPFTQFAKSSLKVTTDEEEEEEKEGSLVFLSVLAYSTSTSTSI